MKKNINSLIEFKAFFQKHHFHHLSFIPASIDVVWDEWTGNDGTLRLDYNDVISFNSILNELNNTEGLPSIDNPFDEDSREWDNNRHSIFSNGFEHCYVKFFHCVIQSNGDVIPCCYANDQYILGNVRCERLERILEKRNDYADYRVTEKMCKSCLQYRSINKIIDRKRLKENAM